MSDYEYTDEMGEVSGLGGDYEEACRNMVIAGVEWLDEQDDDFEFDGEKSPIELLECHPGLETALVDAAKEAGGGPSGAMMGATVRHVYGIHQRGWDGYVEHMEADEDE